MQNSRAKFVQNFFGFYRFFRDFLKMKNDRKRGRIKASTTFGRGLSNSKDADGGSRTHTPAREHDFESCASASSATSA